MCNDAFFTTVVICIWSSPVIGVSIIGNIQIKKLEAQVKILEKTNVDLAIEVKVLRSENSVLKLVKDFKKK